MTAEFVKYEVLGNSYVVVDVTVADLPADGSVARLVSDRNFGVGADGVIFGPYEQGGDVALRVFNPDGSECPGSGNGLSIFAHHVRRQGHVQRDRFTLRAASGPVDVRIVDLDEALVEVTLGRATTTRDTLAVDGRNVEITCVSVGTPHCVVLAPVAGREEVERQGRAMGTHPLFPQKTNVEFVSPVDRSAIRVEVWERGAGYTLASGAGACAAATAARALGLVEEDVTVLMPGGEVRVSVRPGNVVALRGTVREVVRGTFAEGFRARMKTAAAEAGSS
ncbi:diaminopimelate epimerase [Streptomyces sp. yr375]|uniref:diaminopimelate epimerase n=1 Tax=Streptomyces sp. yr375 TaxID=1761906 RepID=UPI0008C37B67|nr:diaminopimelate epimerase [Streptomyces sp. yr375]SES03620.1 diaminopimelate epimerase [Streptomyces sp. yr375]